MQKIAMLVAAMAAFLAQPATPARGQDAFVAGLRSVKIAVTDFERSAQFYRALGMEDGMSRPDVHEMVWNDAATQNSGVMMVSSAYAERAGMAWGGTYLMIVSADIDATVSALKTAGFQDIGEPMAMGGMVKLLIIKDPDGNIVELIAPVS